MSEPTFIFLKFSILVLSGIPDQPRQLPSWLERGKPVLLAVPRGKIELNILIKCILIAVNRHYKLLTKFIY